MRILHLTTSSWRCDGVLLAGLGAASVPGLHLGSGAEVAGLAALAAALIAGGVWSFCRGTASPSAADDVLDEAFARLLRHVGDAARSTPVGR